MNTREQIEKMGPCVPGLDVSKYQGRVDWGKVKADGYRFAIARVSDGVKHLDEMFALNYQGIREAGIIRGVYQFIRFDVSIQAQANLVLSSLDNWAAGDLPPTIDVETAPAGMGALEIVEKIEEWMHYVGPCVGRQPMIYTGPGFWNSRVKSARFADCPLWVADYSHVPAMKVTGWEKPVIHQYSDQGVDAGIPAKVDLNFWLGDEASLRAFCVVNTCG